jgi:hypothetical protein
MEVPDFFEDEESPRMPQERRSADAPPPDAPYVKDSSVALPWRPEMRGALDLARRRGDVVTSGAEGYPGDAVHEDTSLHYDQLAIDVRWARDRRRQQDDYAAAGYTLWPEKTHLHVSHDPEGKRI